MEYNIMDYICMVMIIQKTIIIIGAGPGIGIAVAERFGKAGYKVGLISRDIINSENITERLKSIGIIAYAAQADVKQPEQLRVALKKLIGDLGGLGVVLYNAAVLKSKNIMEETGSDLIDDLKVNLSGALDTLHIVREGLLASNGAMLITGGGLSDYPSAQYGSLSIGKSALKSLALQLNKELKPTGIYVGLLTINGSVNPNDPKYSPAKMAEQFWEMAQIRNQAERKI
jgi:short-subunit dehydrogenase